MKTISAELQSYLNDNSQFIVADLYIFSLLQTSWNEETSNLDVTTIDLHFTNFDHDIIFDGNVFLANKIVITRESMKLVLGVEVDPLQIKLSAPSDYTVFSGVNLSAALTAGVFDGARVKLQKAFINDDTSVAGAIHMFSGRVSETTISRLDIDMTIKSDLELLNIQMPRSLYQPSCVHTLFNADCALNKPDYVESSVVGSSAINSINCVLSNPAGYYDLGVVVFTSGVLNNQSKTIKSWDGSKLTFLNLIGQLPAINDTFIVYPGCNKTIDTCKNKYDNLVHFKGFPYIPSPEVAIY